MNLTVRDEAAVLGNALTWEKLSAEACAGDLTVLQYTVCSRFKLIGRSISSALHAQRLKGLRNEDMHSGSCSETC